MLSDTRIKSAKTTGRSYKMADGGGLYLFVTAKGAKSWRYDYRLAAKRKTFVVGLYP
ncbi:MAG: Arm DNA-binding domain-containing protein, partial [Burkholderiales bacterium]